MVEQWSVHHLTEYLSEVGAQQDEASAVRLAAERAAEALDAEIGAVVVGGDLVASFGFGRATPPADLIEVARAAGSVAVPRLGAVEVRCADLGRHVGGLLLVGRAGDPLTAEEQEMLHGMARMLGLALRGIRMLAAERLLSQQRVELALADARTAAAEREAFFDPLTGLANRARFVDLLRSASTSAPVVLYLDLDGFKAVNDSLGHQAGDQLLTVVAARINGCLRDGDTAARLGGDEFAVLLNDTDLADARGIAERIIASVRAPVDLDGRPATVAASIGIATGADELLDAADIAMYQAKRAGKGRFVVFEPAMRAARAEREAQRAKLRRAVFDDALTSDYQPIRRLDTGETVAVEALLRWPGAARGPVEFVPLAEEAGVIRELGNRVLVAGALAVMGRPGLGLHVNVSARQVEDRSFPDDVADALARTGLPPHALTLELTESALLGDPASVRANLAAVHRLGVRISVDDFGAGCSSLSQLQRYAVDEVKIDRELVAAMSHRPGALSLVRAVIAVGRALGVDVVAEGIESPSQLATLRRLGCRFGQGFHLDGLAGLPWSHDHGEARLPTG